MTVHSNFAPQYGATQTVTPAAASAQIAIGKDCRTVRVSNTGTNIGSFRIGTGTITASGADMPVEPGKTGYVSKEPTWDQLAHISAAGTTFVITPGNGGMGSGQ